MNTTILILIFIIAIFAGFKIINQVPNLLHTPLMSGMNALSGVTVLGALVATAAALSTGSRLLGFFATVLAAVNLVGGFVVTDRMLKMFKAR